MTGAGSRANVRVSPYVTSGQVARVARLRLPPGVDVLGNQRSPTVWAHPEVDTPRRFLLLSKLMTRVIAALDRPTPGWVLVRLTELAYRQAQAAEDALGNHYTIVPADEENEDEPPHEALDLTYTRTMMGQLRRLRHQLRMLSDHPEDPQQATGIRAFQELPSKLISARVHRRYSVSARPGSVEVHLPAIEEFTLRADPTRTVITASLAVTKSETLATATTINATNVITLALVTLLLGVGQVLHPGAGSPAEVLATLLTIFPSIQASRIPKLNSAQLVGVLSATHFRWGLATVLPSLFLAGMLAVVDIGWWIIATSAAMTALQAAFFVPFRRLQSGRPDGAPIGWTMTSVDDHRSDRHQRLDSLYSTWCRDLTGEALLVGRAPYAYLSRQSDAPGGFAALLTSTAAALREPRRPRPLGGLPAFVLGPRGPERPDECPGHHARCLRRSGVVSLALPDRTPRGRFGPTPERPGCFPGSDPAPPGTRHVGAS